MNVIVKWISRRIEMKTQAEGEEEIEYNIMNKTAKKTV